MPGSCRVSAEVLSSVPLIRVCFDAGAVAHRVDGET